MSSDEPAAQSENGRETLFPIVLGETLTLDCGGVYCNYSSSNGETRGFLALTQYRLRFESNDSAIVLDLPLGLISEITKVDETTQSYGIQVVCKDVRSLQFANIEDQQGDEGYFFNMLTQYAFPLSHNIEYFAFRYQAKFAEDGWAVYNAAAELKRQGLPNAEWRICRINAEYQLCETYPAVLGVPEEADDQLLESVAKFRSKNRIPALSWIHPETHATITRCSQPLVGVIARRSVEDERYISYILSTNADSPEMLFIADARPYINAEGNRITGGGYELWYRNTKVIFLDIDNIHGVRRSFNNHTEWLSHIATILTGVNNIAAKVQVEKASVIVHCSDGWDRTPQLTSLAMLLLDPYYRTLIGFEVLIEKEWCSFGHKFEERYGHGVSKGTCSKKDRERSPVFVQFIECTWQVMQQFPEAFEFNENFLVTILDHLYSNLFGTFLYDCERIRSEKNVKTSTQSLWSMVNSNVHLYLNPLYNEKKGLLVPNPGNIITWLTYYYRWSSYAETQQPLVKGESELLGLTRGLPKFTDENLSQNWTLTEQLRNQQKQTYDVVEALNHVFDAGVELLGVFKRWCGIPT